MGSIVKTIGTSGNVRASEGAGTTTLTISDNPRQMFNLSAGRTCVLPTTSVLAGHTIILENRANFQLTVQSSDLTTILFSNGGSGSVGDASIYKGSVTLIATQNTPTAASHWIVADVYEEFTATLDNQFTGGDFRANRRGRLVNGTIYTPTWTSTRSDTESSALLPVSMRTVSTLEITNISRGGSSVHIFEVTSGGIIRWNIRSGTNLATSSALANPSGIGVAGTWIAY